jgi:D-3-phosphoglycerate dehydrogenase / 2-oxoglutarate reductase
MAAHKRVVRTDLWIDPAFDARLKQEADVSLAVFPARGNSSAAWDLLGAAHVYHVSAAKDELPREWFVTGELLARCPQLLCVSSSGAGYDTVDVAACTAAGVAVVNQAGGNAASVAEHTLAMMLSLSRRMIECDKRMRRETGFTREQIMGHELRGQTVGLVGVGHVGTRVAALARAFGLEVIAADPYVAPEEIQRRGARPVTLDQLLAQADVVSLHCPRDATTLKMIDARAFSKMKKGALFITTSRGGIHDEQALVEALRSGHLAGAGVDVWYREPPPLDHPLLAMDNVVASPHIAGMTVETMTEMCEATALQWLTIFDGGVPPRLVNPEVWPRYAERFAELLGFRPADPTETAR